MKQSDKLKQILDELHELSEDERDEIQTHLKMIKSLAPGLPLMGGAGGVQDDSDLFLQQLCAVLSSAGIEFVQPTVLAKTNGYSTFKGKVPGVMKFLRRAVSSRNELRVLLYIALGLLYQDLTKQGIPVSSRLMMAHAHRIPSVLNAAFPGYAQIGLLRMIINRKVSDG